jgi:hypothetical protein
MLYIYITYICAATQHKPYTAEGQGDGNASRAAAARVTEGKGKSVAVAEEVLELLALLVQKYQN